MTNLLEATLHPAWYHGQRTRPPYFEGWYFKLIGAGQEHRYAVIPGIFKGAGPEASHAFVQVLDGVTGQATYHRYPAEDFWAAEQEFDVRVGPNHFTLEHIHLQIEAPEQTVSGQVAFSGLTPWPVTLASPGIMGWYAWMPLMECYHGVLSLDHALDGVLTVDGKRIDLVGGRGYIEKDWGRSFPAAWVWLQTNHFEQPRVSITGSVALIPWVGRTFRGFIVGIWHKGVLYRFATYTGAHIEKLAIGEHDVEWAMRDRQHRLEIHARRTRAGLLRGPSVADMGVRVPETLQATVQVRLSALVGGQERPIYEGTGHSAGLEVAGDIPRLLGER